MASFYGQDAGKTAVRARYLILRRSSRASLRARADARILERLLALDVYRAAPLVLCYVSVGSEVDTRALMARALADGKRLAVPRVERHARRLSFCELSSPDELADGFRGIPEPPADARPISPLAMAGSVCVVPGLVFDADGYRVGYGGGYYDSFLALYPGYKVGLARTWQVSGNPLPREAHDVALDVVVSEDGVFWADRAHDMFMSACAAVGSSGGR